MPMTVKVGLAKKIGQPDYGSLGASCDIELELDGSLLFQDRDGLQDKVRAAYVACRQAINDELASQRGTAASAGAPPRGGTNGTAQSAPPGEPSSHSAAKAGNRTNGSRNGPAPNGKSRGATSSQVRALHAIATRQGFHLPDCLRERFQRYRAEDLTLQEASALIDELNKVPAHGAGGRA